MKGVLFIRTVFSCNACYLVIFYASEQILHHTPIYIQKQINHVVSSSRHTLHFHGYFVAMQCFSTCPT